MNVGRLLQGAEPWRGRTNGKGCLDLGLTSGQRLENILLTDCYRISS